MKISQLVILLIAFTGTAGLAQVPAPGAPQSQPILLTGGTVHVGNGEVIENAAVAFDKGKITWVGKASEVNQDTVSYEVIEVEGKHVYPGFILPNTDIGLKEIGAVRATVDNNETGALNPNVRALISYNTDSELIPTIRFNGILLAQVAPQGSMVPGTSSIVHLDAWNWEDAAVVEDDAMHLNWPGRFTADFDFTTFTVNRKLNEEYTPQVRMLEELFADAAAYHQLGEPQITNLKLEAMKGLFEGSKALFIHSDEPREIIESVNFAQQHGVKRIVLVSGTGVNLVKDFIKEKSIPVIVSNLHVLPETTDDDVDMPYKLPYLLSQEGILVGLGYEADMNAGARNLPFIAGTAAAYGLDKEAALQLITANNAKIMGIEDQAGTLEEGKRAILFVSAGDALDMRSNQVDMAFVDGRQITLPAMQQRLFEKYEKKYSQEGDAKME